MTVYSATLKKLFVNIFGLSVSLALKGRTYSENIISLIHLQKNLILKLSYLDHFLMKNYIFDLALCPPLGVFFLLVLYVQ